MRPKTRLVAGATAGIGVCACPSLVLAHSPIKGMSTFYGHMLHPLAVPAHAILLIAIALMLGQQVRGNAFIGLVSLVLGFAAGLAISGNGLFVGVQEQWLLAGALFVGSAVILGWHAPLAVTGLVSAAAGFAVGLDSAPGGSGGHDMWMAFAGLGFGIIGLAMIITGLTIDLTRQWQVIGVRVAASWIVAVSIMVLALSIAKHPEPQSNAVSLVSGRSVSC